MANFKMLDENMPSLQSLCFDSIIEKFQRFYFAFTETKDPRLLQNMVFLQRRFSNDLICELVKDRKKTDLYFDFLFNEHLTSVDFKWFEDSRYLKSIDEIFKRLPNLLRVRFNFCGDEILKSVTKFCPRMIEINGRGLDLTDEGIKYLCDRKNGKLPCPELKYIAVRVSSISDEGAECLLWNFPSIEKFAGVNLPRVVHSIYTKNVSQRQKVLLFNFTELNLRFNNSYEELKSCITVCPKLETVFLQSIQERELEAIMLSHLRLKKLDLCSSPQINIDRHLKTGGCSLTSLTIKYCSVSASVLAVYCPSLREFSAFYVNFMDDDNDDDPKSFFPSLTSCVLTGISTDTKAFRSFSSSPKLETVELIWILDDRCHLSNEMKNQILKWCRNPAAKHISIQYVLIETNFVEEIFLNCNSLMKINLRGCRFEVRDPVELLNGIAKKYPNRLIADAIQFYRS